MKYTFIMLLFLTHLAQAKQSTCYGSTSAGKILDAVQLPSSGQNFRVFSMLAWYLGRTYVHSQVNQVILSTYEQLAASQPERVYMYAETGWVNGQLFKPHKTHQNGLSVDFMVPVLNEAGRSTELPISMANKWGYDIEFDANGKYKSLNIDFKSMALHLKTLNELALSHGIAVKKVYFDPRLQHLLFETEQGAYLEKHLVFNQKQAWVRHDEHYHVDFEVKCLPLP